LHRAWHKNGRLASEEPYPNGLFHGICRQWDEQGRLLGKFKMTRGTGLQREWHDNGQLQMEVSTFRGEFCGRNRIWLRDGTLLSERFYLHSRAVTAAEYREAATKDKRLPRFRAAPARVPPGNAVRDDHIFGVFIESLMAKPHQSEARSWLLGNGGPASGHSLGRFKSERDAEKFIKQRYHAGAAKVIAPDIYHGKTGAQFADCLLVRLPQNAAKREAVRRVCAQLRRRRLGAVKPQTDIGEPYLYLYLG
jgi:hypothetical protein